ncbi:MAG: hypothetical protein GJ671_02285 [Alteromonadaceae bacterium]|nr:hypothetical protein [Alteromonadaceae bacterium]
MSKIDTTLFSNMPSQAVAQAYGDCPQCNAPLQQKFSKKQSFIGCSNYPQCEYIHNPKSDDDSTIKVMSGTPCPECASDLAIKKGQYGMFLGCTAFPDCHYIGSLNPPADSAETQVFCPKCKTGHYVARMNKSGKTFWGCSEYPKCDHITNQQP